MVCPLATVLPLTSRHLNVATLFNNNWWLKTEEENGLEPGRVHDTPP